MKSFVASLAALQVVIAYSLVSLVDHVLLIDAFAPKTAGTSLVVKSFATDSKVKTKQYAVVTKRQHAIFDGSEFLSIVSFLQSDGQMSLEGMQNMRAGYMTIVTGTLDSQRIVGIEYPESEERNDLISLEDGTVLYKDSIAIIPKDISNDDAISTAAAAICGVHCGMPRSKDNQKSVVIGGGDYACFTAKGMSDLGVQVTMVTSRPMELKDTFLNPLRDSKVEFMGPITGENGLGFSASLDQFDTVVDTLGDEAQLDKISKLEDLVTSGKRGIPAGLRTVNGCNRYISSVTRSQQFVQKEGLLFARKSVVEYQKQVEETEDTSTHLESMMRLSPPRNYGTETLQVLLDRKTLFPAGKNENGDHEKKEIFVRGWALSDYTEREMWPSNTDGNRFGFPEEDRSVTTIDLVKPQVVTKTPKQQQRIRRDNTSKERRDQPSVTENISLVKEISNLRELGEEIREDDTIVFLYAPYCRMCKAIDAGWNRMARLSKEKGNNINFLKASIAGKAGKQLAFSLVVDSVPVFFLFKNGQKYGEPLYVTKVPSKELDLALEFLASPEMEWDPKPFQGVTTRRRRKKKQFF